MSIERTDYGAIPDEDALEILAEIPSDIPEWAQTIIAQQVTMQATFNQILTICEALQQEAGPIIDSLSRSPMLRMLTGGK